MNKTRLDLFLASQHPQYSRTQIKKLIDEGFVLVDGERKKPSFILNGGEEIRIARRAPEIPKAEPEEIPLDILYEDDDLLVINKRAGIVVHPAPGNLRGTLVNAILYYLQAADKGPSALLPPSAAPRRTTDSTPASRLSRPPRIWDFSQRPGIVHRLDKGTSGVMVVAKNERAQRNLSDQFKNRKVEKTYQALVFGKFLQKRGTISFSIGRDREHRRKFSSRSRRTREAVTHFEIVRQREGIALLTIKLETGRTHQIRVHLSESGHPIVGDSVYGAKSFLSQIKEEGMREILEEVSRPMLHAWRLSFFHPARRERVSFEAPFPADFCLVEGLLRGDA